MPRTLTELTALAQARAPGPAELVDHLPMAVLVCDLAGNIVSRNPAYQHLFGDPAPYQLGHLRELFDDAGRARLPETIGAAFFAAGDPGRGSVDDVVTTAVRNDGAPFPCGLTIRVVGVEDPGGTYIVAVLRALSEEARRAEQLRRSEHRYATLLAHLPVGIIGSESGLRADYVNATGAEVLGADTESLLGLGWLAMVHPEDASRASDAVEDALADRRPAFAPLRVERPDGEERWVHLRVAPMGIGDDLGFVASIQDVSEQKELTEAIAHQACHDQLTGLLNRSMVEEQLEECLEQAVTTGARPAVVFVDLDDFKDVNDAWGHLAGDQVLAVSADRLFHCCGHFGSVARFGGDEFVVIVPHVSSSAAALEMARRVVGALSQPVALDGHDVHLTASAGVVWPGSQDLATIDATELLRRADLALYQAKKAGKHRAAMADDTMMAAERRRLRLTRALRDAIDEDLLDVHYQPIVDLADDRIVGLEALVRWTDPDLGRVNPDVFVPTAEDNGMVAALGRNVLRRALGEVAGWRRLPGCERLYVSVNMSMHELDEQTVARQLAIALGEADLPASALYVELTESALLRRETTAIERLDAIRRLGVRLAIDDFGTGYSSLARLRRLPVDLLKIDREFVRDLGADHQATEIVRAISALASALGLTTVAEGIETEIQRQELCRVARGYGQGYLFSEPVPAGQVPDLLALRPLRHAA